MKKIQHDVQKKALKEKISLRKNALFKNCVKNEQK